MKIAFDFARLSTPYGLKRCSHQMMHLALAAEHLCCQVAAIVSEDYLREHRFMDIIKHLWVFQRPECDIYIAKSDAFYRDDNWKEVSKIDAFKVCLCNSDRCFREFSVPFRDHVGAPVQTRCDLYMPTNHTAKLMEEHGHKVIPVAHPIDPRMFRLFCRRGIYEAYVTDDVQKIRDMFSDREPKKAGFMGSSIPGRCELARHFPDWVDFNWTRKATSEAYVRWMLRRRGCVDFRGFGDKSLRFTEAVLLNRTLITSITESTYIPRLKNGHNCLLFDSWQDIELTYDRNKWLSMASNATDDYLSGWSMMAQMRKILERAR